MKKKEIITISKNLFLEMDYQNTKIKDIIEKANITEDEFNQFFKSKEDILDAVVKQIADEYIVKVQANFKSTKSNALENLQALIKASNVSNDEKKLLDKLHRPGNALMHSYLLAITTTKLAPFYAAIIQQGTDKGIFNVDHPLEIAELLIAGIQHLTDIGCYPWEQKDLMNRKEIIPSLCETVLHAPKGSFKDLNN